MDTQDNQDKETEWALFLLQLPSEIQFRQKLLNDLRDKTVPKNKTIAEKAISCSDRLALDYYIFCKFKDEDRKLFKKINGASQYCIEYLKKIDSTVKIKVPLYPYNIPIIDEIYSITGRGFELYQKLMQNKIAKSVDPTMKQIQEIRDNTCLCSYEFIKKAVEYLESNVFGERNYVAFFIAGAIRERLKFMHKEI
jgi:hypothetical protein